MITSASARESYALAMNRYLCHASTAGIFASIALLG